MTKIFEQLPELETPRLLLRPLRRSDATRLGEIGTDDVFRYTPDIGAPFDAEAWVNLKFGTAVSPLAHVLVEKATGLIVGYCQVDVSPQAKHYVYSVGYWLGRDYWGRGYATEALQAVMAFVVTTGWRRLRVFAFVDAENPASRRVLEKCGFEARDPKPDILKDSSMLAFEWTWPSAG